MTFEPTNEPSTSQRLMYTTLSRLVLLACLVYLDDFIVHGSSFRKHLENLQVVLGRHQKFDLKVQP